MKNNDYEIVNLFPDDLGDPAGRDINGLCGVMCDCDFVCTDDLFCGDDFLCSCGTLCTCDSTGSPV